LAPLQVLEPVKRLVGYTVTAHKVPHGHNGFSYGLLFENTKSRWAYIPDSINLQDFSPWQNLELLILGTSFYREEAKLQSRSVYDVQEALELIKQLQPKHTVFTHLGHGVDRRKNVPSSTSYAYDGLILPLDTQ
jgi:phosphoribosyl 1,2-cyclic phosphate phosphodiesterase